MQLLVLIDVNVVVVVVVVGDVISLWVGAGLQFSLFSVSLKIYV